LYSLSGQLMQSFSLWRRRSHEAQLLEVLERGT
jgi:hypothetical protein